MAKIARNLLIVEDDIGIQNQLKWSLDDFDVALTDNHDDAITAVRATEPAIVLLDLGLPPDPGGASEGLRTLRSILEIAPATKIIIITGNDDKAHAVDAVGSGAYDFYNKPIDADALAQVVSRAERLYQLERENKRLQLLSTPSALDGVIAVCEPMVKVCRDIEKIAPMNISALLLGESGTGKELLAKALHELSPRAHNEMVSINCAAIPENLLESELFGYEKGAFTGATERKAGKFEAADKGTLMLDEIGEMSPSIQAKFLRVLEGHPFERVGGSQAIQVNVRVIAATNRALEESVRKGTFRKDLFFRLHVVQIDVPPLRNRPGDILPLSEHFLQKYKAETGRKIEGFSPQALQQLKRYRWPGNVRELKNVIERAVVLASGSVIELDELMLTKLTTNTESQFDFGTIVEPYHAQTLEEVERRHIEATLHSNNWNKSQSAKILGIERSTLDRKIKKFEIVRNV